MLADEMPEAGTRSPKSMGGSSVGLLLYVENVDAAFDQAVKAGAKVDSKPVDMFWGDRYGKLTDPFGHTWSLATHIEDVGPDEMKRRAKAAMAQMKEHAHSSV